MVSTAQGVDRRIIQFFRIRKRPKRRFLRRAGEEPTAFGTLFSSSRMSRSSVLHRLLHVVSPATSEISCWASPKLLIFIVVARNILHARKPSCIAHFSGNLNLAMKNYWKFCQFFGDKLFLVRLPFGFLHIEIHINITEN